MSPFVDLRQHRTRNPERHRREPRQRSGVLYPGWALGGLRMSRSHLTIVIGLLLGCLAPATLAAVPPPDSPSARQDAEKLDRLPPAAPHGRAAIDHSGRKERGRASFYARGFARRKMADGRPMNLN